MTTNQDHLKNLRNVLLAERERLGINVPAAQIGARDSSGPIDTGMSDALEQLVLLAQLHAGRTDANISRGYTEANISLVRQYMKDRGVNMDQVDLFTGTVQALDTQASGQPKSLFDQQYSMGGTDLTIFRIQNEALLRETTATGAVAAPRPLTALFAAAAPAAPAAPAPAAPAAPERAMTRFSTSYSYDQIQELRDKDYLSVQERAVLQDWDSNWQRYSREKGYTDIYNRYDRAREAWANRFETAANLRTEAASLRQQNATLLADLKDDVLHFRANGQDYEMTWQQAQDAAGWWHSDEDEALVNAANRALEALKDSRGYNARAEQILEKTREANSVVATTHRELIAASAAKNTAFENIRDDQIRMTVMIPDFNATPGGAPARLASTSSPP